ncbi:MAG: 4-hydroxy-tetrahydrodipicolinate synthase [Candidatus Ordinivivax streblomastigis]|uniref:4-hydroxy-tetrahydrodipicolinate synthase n=1 Tax=Candidatus Ordinivivax streblomastigis TaxID=2540710 RepID=A0A5M8NZJ1_9BACT|nr:MAG: 4-hydroxy-tetrahydrodipicolinate synthase [Candidatus Ordinivivax streblomastigis]
MNLKGLGVALITPFQSNGKVDENALLQLADYQLQSGVDYLVALGTTAETPTLSFDEQKKILQLLTAKVNHQIPVVWGLGGNNTAALVQGLQTADFSGIDAVLSVVPYYNKPSQEGIYQHYKQLAEASPVPIVLYNVPGRTGVNLCAETTLRLAQDFNNIIAIKEASGNREQIKTIINHQPANFQVISGDDGLTIELMQAGAVGVISVLGNAFPKEFGQIVHLCLEGDYQTAAALEKPFADLLRLLFVEGSPAGIKNILHQMGRIENTLRLPLTPVSPAIHDKIAEALRAYLL